MIFWAVICGVFLLSVIRLLFWLGRDTHESEDPRRIQHPGARSSCPVCGRSKGE